MRARWCHWVFVPVVAVAIQLMIRRFGGVDAQCSDEVEGDAGLDGKLIPQLEWEICVGSAQATNEVVFERLDCAFCRIYSVVVGLHKLSFAFVLLEVSFERLDCLIVCDIELGLMSLVDQLRIRDA